MTAERAYPSFSACFIPVADTNSITLGDIKPTGMFGSLNDMIQTLSSSTSEQTGQYLYFSKEESRMLDEGGLYDEYIGWWKDQVVYGTRADDTPITVGTAFLGNVLPGSSISFQCSGEAPTYTTKFTTDGGKFPFFGNFIPKDLKLKDIVVVGMKGSENDMIQTLDPSTSDQNGQYLYFSLEESRYYDQGGAFDSYIGWWKGQVVYGERVDNTPVSAGTAFLGNISSGSQTIEFKFPSVLEDAE